MIRSFFFVASLCLLCVSAFAQIDPSKIDIVRDKIRDPGVGNAAPGDVGHEPGRPWIESFFKTTIEE